MYDSIILGGLPHDSSGRSLGLYRLRTSAERAGYNIKVIDFVWALDENQLLTLLGKLITEKTKVVGLSSAWFERSRDCNTWATQSFFTKFRELFPDVLIITGGTKPSLTLPLLYRNSAWYFIGFSDISFVHFLDYLNDKRPAPKYTEDLGVKVVSSDTDYIVSDMREIETVFRPEDNFLEYQPIPIELSRGCIFKCAFCSHPFLGKKNFDYMRPADSIATELKRNYDLFGTYRYTLADDTFNDTVEKITILKTAIELAGLPKFEFCAYIKPEILVTKPQMVEMLVGMGLKGAFAGIETFNPNGRRVVGKGMNVERVLAPIKRMRELGVKVTGSFIVGLPGDTEEDVLRYRDFLIESKDTLFNYWNFKPLSILKNPISEHNNSLFEKDPSLYGYTIQPNAGTSTVQQWTSDTGMTLGRAIQLADQINRESLPHSKIAAWHLASAWFHNVPQEIIDNTPLNEIDLGSIVKKNSNRRAFIEYDKIVSK